MEETNVLFADYIIEMARYMADGGYIYESTTGDITAPLLTGADIMGRADEYRGIILGRISDPNIVMSIREDNGKRMYQFYIGRCLIILGIGTHMGNGIPGYLDVATRDVMNAPETAIFTVTL